MDARAAGMSRPTTVVPPHAQMAIQASAPPRHRTFVVGDHVGQDVGLYGHLYRIAEPHRLRFERRTPMPPSSACDASLRTKICSSEQ